jgi:hypothetical protein
MCACSTPLQPKDVFVFYNNDTDFLPSEDFTDDLERSQSPVIILFVGNGRSGKSTRLNQLLSNDLRPDGPFEADDGIEPVTMKFQYVGPLKFADLAQIHKIQLNVTSDPEVFLIDCEGLGSLSERTPALEQATFALAQMATLTVLVTKEPVNHHNLDNIRSLLILSHAFTREAPGFSVGTTIMMREIGLKRSKGKKLSPQEKDAIRRQTDESQRHTIIAGLNKARIKFAEKDLLVLAQPPFDDAELYWKSIQDLLLFAAGIASSRGRISGATLLSLFNLAKPSIMKVEDFAQPSIPFEQIMGSVITRHLQTATEFAVQDLDHELNDHLSVFDSQSLRSGQNVSFILDLIGKCTKTFEAKADSLLPRLLEYSPDETENCRHSIQDTVRVRYEAMFIKRCVAVVLPELQREIVGVIRNEI